MTINAALWASSTALTCKAALAFWCAALLFENFDRRKLVIGWQVLLVLCVIPGAILAISYSSSPLARTLWGAAGAIACASMALNVRQWTQTSPRETFEEASQLDPLAKKKTPSKSKRIAALKTQSKSPIAWVDLLGLVVTAVALATSTYGLMSAQKGVAILSVAHTTSACLLWGISIFCALELTFGSAPLSLSAVNWTGVSILALGGWITESCVAAAIILSPTDSDSDFQSIAMTRLFAISILLIDFVVWMIPHRVAKFKRTGKADSWVSLSMAAWIGMLSLAVLCALPVTWPWRT